MAMGDLERAEAKLEAAETKLQDNPMDTTLKDDVLTFHKSVVSITNECTRYRNKIESLESSSGSPQLSQPLPASPFQINVIPPILLRLWDDSDETPNYDMRRVVSAPQPSLDILHDLESLTIKAFGWTDRVPLRSSLKFYFFPFHQSYADRVKIQSIAEYLAFVEALKTDKTHTVWIYLEPVDSNEENKSPFKGAPPPRINTKIANETKHSTNAESIQSPTLTPDESPSTARNRAQQQDFADCVLERDDHACVLTGQSHTLQAVHLFPVALAKRTLPRPYLEDCIKSLRVEINEKKDPEKQDLEILLQFLQDGMEEHAKSKGPGAPVKGKQKDTVSLHHSRCIPLSRWYYPEFGLCLPSNMNILTDTGKAWFEPLVDGSVQFRFLEDSIVAYGNEYKYLLDRDNHISLQNKKLRQPQEPDNKTRWPPTLVFNLHAKILAPYYRKSFTSSPKFTEHQKIESKEATDSKPGKTKATKAATVKQPDLVNELKAGKKNAKGKKK